MMPPTSIDGTDITGATIDGTDVQEITVDGDSVFTAVVEDRPDSGLLHNWDAVDNSSITTDSSGNVTQWNDLVGGEHLTGQAGALNSINGVQAILFKDDQEFLDVGFGTNISQPYDIYTVSEVDFADVRCNIFDGANQFACQRHEFDNNRFLIFHGSTVIANGAQSTDPHIHVSIVDGSNSAIRRDGSILASGNAGTDSFNGLTAGNRRQSAGGDMKLNGPIGEILIYDPTDAGYSVSRVESYLSQKWGV